MFRTVAIVALCVSGSIYAQSAATQRFEVASIKLSSASADSTSGIATGHGRVDGNNVTLKRCIMGAYGVGPSQIAGGPDWLESERYEILAKADRPTNDDAVLMMMLQGLLAERFKLALHRETRTISSYVLEVAKNGPKLEKAPPGEAGTNTSTSNTAVTIDAHNTDMDAFARILGRKTDLPVVNRTGLDGIFNFRLHWTPESAMAAKGGATEGPSVFTALQEQLGLRLRAQKAPVEFLVIDHAEKPSAN
jgi:uncharacterized protein (TIGR03435 family)